MKKLHSLSAFFPCYNEESNVPLFVAEALEVLPKLAKKFEIIIVNDGSTDETKNIATQLAKKDTRIKVVNHQHNRGYGAALRSGFQAAQYDWIFFTDGDLQFKLTQLTEFVSYAQDYQAIIGYRKNRAEGSLRAFNARLFKLYVDILYRIHVRDIDCAFKLLKADLIKSLPLISTGAFTSAEFLYRLKKQGVKFKQLPVDHLPRQYGSPTGNNLKVIIKAGWEAFRIYLKVKFGI
ncbi:MAG: glycosyltransferase [Candidatus Pacebacteria bacterium]|nr:glycosyltransferase [Candidatus Paceibacterota bacterium]